MLYVEADHSHSCVMVQMPASAAKVLDEYARRIPDEVLAEDGRTEPDKFHCTLLYGLTTSDWNEVQPYAPTQPLHIKLGPVTRLTPEGRDYEVLVVEVISDDCYEAHLRLSELPNENEFKGFYRSHVTLAYVQPGQGKEFEGKRLFDDDEIVCDTLVWSPKGAEQLEHIKLKALKQAWFASHFKIEGLNAH